MAGTGAIDPSVTPPALCALPEEYQHFCPDPDPDPPSICGQLVPVDQCDRVEVINTPGILEVLVLKEVSNLDLVADSDIITGIAGKKVADSVVTAKSFKGDRTLVALHTTKFNTSDIIFKGFGDKFVDVMTGCFNNNSITFNKKSSDFVEFQVDVEVRNATINAGRGADTIIFKENSVIKGTNEITLGQGKDVLELPANKKGKGKIDIIDLAGNDTIKIGDQSFSGRDILKGKTDLPKYVQLKSKR